MSACKTFKKDQLVTVVGSILGGAMDYITACLPPTVTIREFMFASKDQKNVIHGTVQGAGSSIAVFAAAAMDDGVSIGDYKEWESFKKMVDKYVADCSQPDTEPPQTHPDTTPFAEALVNAIFPAAYLRGWKDDGFDLTDSLYCNWPDDAGTIVVLDEYGNTVESVEESGSPDQYARWKQLRDLMPADAAYYQPSNAGDHDAGTSAANIKSYEVYCTREAAKAAHPDCNIDLYTRADIEGPKFLDVADPVLFFNKGD
jgi:hypothetical protein